MLVAEVVDTAPSSLATHVALEFDDGGVTIQPLLLNPKDALRLRLVACEPIGDVTASARIAGIQDIERREAVAPEQQQAANPSARIAAAAVGVGGVLALVTLVIATVVALLTRT